MAANSEGPEPCKSAVIKEIVAKGYAEKVRGNLGKARDAIYNVRFEGTDHETLTALAEKVNLSVPALLIESIRDYAESEYGRQAVEWKDRAEIADKQARADKKE